MNFHRNRKKSRKQFVSNESGCKGRVAQPKLLYFNPVLILKTRNPLTVQTSERLRLSRVRREIISVTDRIVLWYFVTPCKTYCLSHEQHIAFVVRQHQKTVTTCAMRSKGPKRRKSFNNHRKHI